MTPLHDSPRAENISASTTQETEPALTGNDQITLLAERSAKRGYPILHPDTMEQDDVVYNKFCKTREEGSEFIWVGMKGENVVYLPEETEQAANTPGEPSEHLKQSAATASNKQDKADRNREKHEDTRERTGSSE